MKAVIRDRYGHPEVLEQVEIDRPVPGEGEVLIRIRATSLNASDWEIMRGVPLYGRLNGLFTPRTRVLGSDISGIVEANGPGGTQFAVGDAVYGDIFETWGGFAEWVCAPERALRAKPGFLTFEQAAAIPQGATLALQGIRDRGQVKAGQSVLINGGGGSAGTFAIQIAKSLGAEVTGVDSAHKSELMRDVGADHVIDFTHEDYTRSGRRYDLILDLVGHHSTLASARALTSTGRYLLVGGAMRYIFGVLILGSLISLFTGKSMGILPLVANQGLDAIEEAIASGALRPVIERTYPLEETATAMAALGAGLAKGKLVIVMGDSALDHQEQPTE